MKRLALICGLLASSFSFGADWAYVVSSNADKFYIDKGFYKFDQKNNTIDVWTKTTTKKTFDEGYYTSSKTLTRYSCLGKKSMILANIEYSANGAVLNSSTKPSGKFDIIFPDTIAEALWITSCSSKGKGFSIPQPEFVDLKSLGYQENKAP